MRTINIVFKISHVQNKTQHIAPTKTRKERY